MTALHDLLIRKPLPDAWLRTLLTFGFFLHAVFVLLTIGAAILGVSWLVAQRRWPRTDGTESPEWNFRPFFVYQSLAIVLGVGPLLLMQVNHSVPLASAANLIAPLWMAIIVLLIAALALMELASCRKHAACGLLGVACLFGVAGVLSLLVVVTENPGSWMSVLPPAGRLPSALSWHWLFRVLHIIGAAVLVTSAVYSLRPEDEGRLRWLYRWMFGATAFQFTIGIALYASLPRAPQAMIAALVVAGVAAAGMFLWTIGRSSDASHRPSAIALLGLPAVILTLMLGSRQLLQDQVLTPLAMSLSANADVYRERLASLRDGLDLTSQKDRESGKGPDALYSRSCAYCHGLKADGAGDDAKDLQIPPEDLSAIRAHRSELRRIVINGVPGTGMPGFGFYTRGQIDGILDFLEKHAGIRSHVEPLTVPVSKTDQTQAWRLYLTKCIACHGKEGHGSELGRTLVPSPPDLSVFTLAPQRAFAVITHGYPGTRMPSFASVPEPTRWGLVGAVHSLYEEPKRPAD